VKPDSEDGSLGIEQGSVVADRATLIERVDRMAARYGNRVLIEAFLPGREFNVGLLALPDPEPMAIAEVLFQGPADSWPILTYDAKWALGSAEDRSSPVRCPASIDRRLAEELGRLALDAFRATGCRDYARVDLRLDQQGAPMILEVNPNPDLGPGSGWARALQATGRDYAETLAHLADQAIERHRSSIDEPRMKHGMNTD
jgi:D-alanine-D-alanine ligase